jgi:hypothetical protein
VRRLNAPLPSPHNAQQLRSFFPGLFSSCTLQMCNNTNFGAGGGWVWSTPQVKLHLHPEERFLAVQLFCACLLGVTNARKSHSRVLSCLSSLRPAVISSARSASQSLNCSSA